MVVGTGRYKDTNEAYPLDKKMLRSIALRSFLSGVSMNAETGESIGWAWAIAPALKKIHTNEEDLALSMGHNLEYVNTGGYLSTLAMGITLAMEQQKADLETIRAVRTASGAVCESIGKSLFRFVLIPLTAACTVNTVSNGEPLGALIYFLVLTVLMCAMRFALIDYGYAKGIRAAEKLIRHQDALKHASQILGLFTCGALIVSFSVQIYSGAAVFVNELSGLSLSAAAGGIFRGVIGAAVTYYVYRQLTEKNKSLAWCILIILLGCMIAAFFGFFGTSVLPLPWVS